MTSAERLRNRRLYVKSSDQGKSLSPLDKDDLKWRCLQRLRTERQRLMSKNRDRQYSPAENGAGQVLSSNLATVFGVRSTFGEVDEGADNGSGEEQPPRTLSSARDILRYGLNDIQAAAGRRRGDQEQTDGQQSTPKGSGLHSVDSRECAGLPRSPLVVADSTQDSRMEMEEESAYRSACSAGAWGIYARTPSGRTAVQHTPVGDGETPSADLGNERGPAHGKRKELCVSMSVARAGNRVDGDVGRESDAMDGDGLEDDSRVVKDAYPDEWFDEEHLLSPEEYVEMMRYIEDACRQEDLRAEAELLREYERNRRLEEDAVESIVASNLDMDVPDQNGVLCPVCKRDYLLEAGPPSTAIFCACGFRLDTCGDGLGLENIRQQLRETYAEHSAGCNAEPAFSLEGSSGLEVLWSACDGCGFARVVL